jgi:hypothetical protein
MTSSSHIIRRRRSRRQVPGAAGVAVGVALGFGLGVVAEVFLAGGGWFAALEDVLYPLAFLFSLAGAFAGGVLLLSAEFEGDQRRAWRSATVFVASTVFAAVLFWGVL